MGIISKEEVVRILKGKRNLKIPNISSYTPLEKSLLVLRIVKDNTQFKKITAKTISFVLNELKEDPINEKSVLRSLANAGNKIKKHEEIDGKIYYEIMSSGREYLKKLSGTSKNVYFFSGKEVWSDSNKVFPKIIEKLKGELIIVDSFYGMGTLHTLEKFGKRRKIRFLSCRLGNDENEEKFKRELQKFKREFKNIEMRKYDKSYELHDRYILAKNALVIIGHGIKDLGGKESFVVFLFEDMVKGFLPHLKNVFEKRWRESNNLVS